MVFVKFQNVSYNTHNIDIQIACFKVTKMLQLML